ncbi:MAG: hypothetical protein LIP05_10215 [Tannerellaceae bacterium]|nr:hypothetical protein [Tannerellaceae bacterium]
MAKVKNYARFYALLAKMPGDKEELKEQFVRSFTNNRTKSLKDMSKAEYDAMCDSMDPNKGNYPTHAQHTSDLKRFRSGVLKRMQKMGIDTTDWAKVDNFCLQKRISGKRFAHLTLEDLQDLIIKLEMISAKSKKPSKRVAERPAPADPIIILLQHPLSLN